MAVVDCWGYEIFLGRNFWEVYSYDGALLADGPGGLQEARNWILKGTLLEMRELDLLPRRH